MDEDSRKGADVRNPTQTLAENARRQSLQAIIAVFCWALGAVLLASSSAEAASDGTVKSQRKISALEGGFTGALDAGDNFGSALAELGDLDGDGVDDVAVGAPGDDDGGGNSGAVWVLFLRADGRVKAHQKITGDLPGDTHPGDSFGSSVANLGDLDGDGVVDLAVGAESDHPGGVGAPATGAAWVLFLNTDGTVADQQKITSNVGGFTGVLDGGDQFGSAVANLGDLDGAGPTVRAVAVGAEGDDDGAGGRGALWVLFLNANGTVASHKKISDAPGGGIEGVLDGDDAFGSAVASLGDTDRDGTTEVVVGAPRDDDGPITNAGAVLVLSLNPDGTVDGHQKVSNLAGGFGNILENGDFFGTALGNIGDLDGDGIPELAVGVPGENDGGTLSSSPGGLWIVFLHPDGTVRARQKISQTIGGFTGTLGLDNQLGSAVVTLGDLDGDGIVDLAAGAPSDDDGATHAGAVWVLFLDEAASDVAVGLSGVEGPDGPAGQGFAWIPDPENNFSTIDFVQTSWGNYNTTNGETRPAWCDVDGDGRHELVLGLGSDTDGAGPVVGGGGFIQVKDDRDAGFAHIAWLQVPWGNYNTGNGETWPACGDLDDDSRDEIVVGLGQGGGGFFYVYDDQDAGFGPHPATPGGNGWVQLGWGNYNVGIGEVRPAVGNLDDDHAEEIVLGLAPGGGGFAQIRDDAGAGFAAHPDARFAGGWIGVPWGTYNANNGETWPAVCDLNGDGDGEVVLGLGSVANGMGGGGFGRIYDSASGFGVPSPPTGILDGGWFQISWGNYNTAVGAMHPACGLNEDVGEELLLGLGSFPGTNTGGYVELKDDLFNGLTHLAWPRVPFPTYRTNDGLTRPAIAR